MSAAPKLHLVFCSHTWAIQKLESAKLDLQNIGLIVELSINSNLAPMFNQVAVKRPGVAGLLSPKASAQQLAQKFDGLPAPLLLAAHPPVPAVAIANGVANLRQQDVGGKDIVLFVNVVDANNLWSVFGQADTVRVLWDMADPPNFALAQLGDQLAKHDGIATDSWEGVFFYRDERRRGAVDNVSAQKAYKEILADYPGLKAVFA
jgi:hypothetical protein